MSNTAKKIPAYLTGDIGYDAVQERQGNVLGQKIAELRKTHNMSLPNLAEVLGQAGIDIRGGSINKWENGDSVPNAYQLIALCKAFGIEDISFFTEEGNYADLNKTGLAKLREYRSLLVASGMYTPRKKSGKIIYIDMPVSTLSVSAGTGAFLDEGNFEKISFPKDTVPEDAEFGIRVSGDSMMPVYQDGQIVWVCRCTELNPGDVGIFTYDGEGYLKVYDEVEPDDPEAFTDSYGVCHMQPVLVSYNPKYPPRMVSPETRFEIIGRVCHMSK